MSGPRCDVLVIGGGLAGLQAAEVAAQFVGDVLLVDTRRVAEAPASLRGACVLAAYLAQDSGGVSDWKSSRVHLGADRPAGPAAASEAALAAQRRGFEATIDEILSHGGGLGDPTLAEYTAVGIYNRIGWLESYGVGMARTAERHYRGFPGPGHGVDRVALLEPPARDVLRAIEASARRFGVRRREGLRVTRIFADAEGVRGACALDAASGERVTLEARAIILAAGGADRLYRAEPGGTAGDGYRLALDAGAELANLEFVAFGPELAAEPSPPPELVLVLLGLGAALEAHDASPLSGVRDTAHLSRELAAALARGAVRLRVPAEVRRALAELPSVAPWLPLLEKPAEVRLGCRALLGGVVHRVYASAVPGLFVAGALATGCHGADLLPGLATSATLYSAENAASAAVTHCSRAARRAPDPSAVRDEERRLEARGERGRSAKPGELARIEESVRASMWSEAALPRSAAGLERAIARLEELRARLDGILARAPAELVAHGELESLIAAGELVCRAALARQESRGQHVRADFPHESDALRAWIGVRAHPGGLAWRRLPVPARDEHEGAAGGAHG